MLQVGTWQEDEPYLFASNPQVLGLERGHVPSIFASTAEDGSISWGCFFVSVLIVRAVLFGVDIRALDFWKLPSVLVLRARFRVQRFAHHPWKA